MNDVNNHDNDNEKGEEQNKDEVVIDESIQENDEVTKHGKMLLSQQQQQQQGQDRFDLFDIESNLEPSSSSSLSSSTRNRSTPRHNHHHDDDDGLIEKNKTELYQQLLHWKRHDNALLSSVMSTSSSSSSSSAVTTSSHHHVDSGNLYDPVRSHATTNIHMTNNSIVPANNTTVPMSNTKSIISSSSGVSMIASDVSTEVINNRYRHQKEEIGDPLSSLLPSLLSSPTPFQKHPNALPRQQAQQLPTKQQHQPPRHRPLFASTHPSSPMPTAATISTNRLPTSSSPRPPSSSRWLSSSSSSNRPPAPLTSVPKTTTKTKPTMTMITRDDLLEQKVEEETSTRTRRSSSTLTVVQGRGVDDDEEEDEQDDKNTNHHSAVSMTDTTTTTSSSSSSTTTNGASVIKNDVVASETAKMTTTSTSASSMMMDVSLNRVLIDGDEQQNNYPNRRPVKSSCLSTVEAHEDENDDDKVEGETIESSNASDEDEDDDEIITSLSTTYHPTNVNDKGEDQTGRHHGINTNNKTNDHDTTDMMMTRIMLWADHDDHPDGTNDSYRRVAGDTRDGTTNIVATIDVSDGCDDRDTEISSTHSDMGTIIQGQQKRTEELDEMIRFMMITKSNSHNDDQVTRENIINDEEERHETGEEHDNDSNDIIEVGSKEHYDDNGMISSALNITPCKIPNHHERDEDGQEAGGEYDGNDVRTDEMIKRQRQIEQQQQQQQQQPNVHETIMAEDTIWSTVINTESEKEATFNDHDDDLIVDSSSVLDNEVTATSIDSDVIRLAELQRQIDSYSPIMKVNDDDDDDDDQVDQDEKPYTDPIWDDDDVNHEQIRVNSVRKERRHNHRNHQTKGHRDDLALPQLIDEDHRYDISDNPKEEVSNILEEDELISAAAHNNYVNTVDSINDNTTKEDNRRFPATSSSSILSIAIRRIGSNFASGGNNTSSRTNNRRSQQQSYNTNYRHDSHRNHQVSVSAPNTPRDFRYDHHNLKDYFGNPTNHHLPSPNHEFQPMISPKSAVGFGTVDYNFPGTTVASRNSAFTLTPRRNQNQDLNLTKNNYYDHVTTATSWSPPRIDYTQIDASKDHCKEYSPPPSFLLRSPGSTAYVAAESSAIKKTKHRMDNHSGTYTNGSQLKQSGLISTDNNKTQSKSKSDETCNTNGDHPTISPTRKLQNLFQKSVAAVPENNNSNNNIASTNNGVSSGLDSINPLLNIARSCFSFDAYEKNTIIDDDEQHYRILTPRRRNYNSGHDTMSNQRYDSNGIVNFVDCHAEKYDGIEEQQERFMPKSHKKWQNDSPMLNSAASWDVGGGFSTPQRHPFRMSPFRKRGRLPMRRAANGHITSLMLSPRSSTMPRTSASCGRKTSDVDSSFRNIPNDVNTSSEQLSPQRIEMEREDAIDILTCLVERGIAWKQGDIPLSDTGKTRHQVDNRDCEENAKNPSTSSPLPKDDERNESRISSHLLLPRCETPVLSEIAFVIQELNELSLAEERLDQFHDNSDAHNRRRYVLSELVKSHEYALEMKRASQSASCWLDSIGRRKAYGSRGKDEDLCLPNDENVDSSDHNASEVPSAVRHSHSRDISSSSDKREYDNHHQHQTAGEESSSEDIDLLTMKAMLHSARMEIREKVAVSERLNVELAKCREEIGRLKTLSYKQNAFRSPNRSILDESDDVSVTELDHEEEDDDDADEKHDDRRNDRAIDGTIDETSATTAAIAVEITSLAPHGITSETFDSNMLSVKKVVSQFDEMELASANTVVAQNLVDRQYINNADAGLVMQYQEALDEANRMIVRLHNQVMLTNGDSGSSIANKEKESDLVSPSLSEVIPPIVSHPTSKTLAGETDGTNKNQDHRNHPIKTCDKQDRSMHSPPGPNGRNEKKILTVNVEDSPDDDRDDDNFVTDWSDLSSPLSNPPFHGIRAPIVQTILEQWTDDKSLHASLYQWLDQVLDASYHPDSIPPLTLCSLDQQVRDGFLLHIMPVLFRRPDVRLNVKTRRHRRTVHDIAVTVESNTLSSLLETTTTTSNSTNTRYSDGDVSEINSSVVTHHSAATTEVMYNGIIRQQHEQQHQLFPSMINQHQKDSTPALNTESTQLLINGSNPFKNHNSFGAPTYQESQPIRSEQGTGGGGMSYDEVAEDMAMTPDHVREAMNYESSGLLLSAFGGALGGLLGRGRKATTATPMNNLSSAHNHHDHDGDPNASYGYETTPQNYYQPNGMNQFYVTPPAFFGYNDLHRTSRVVAEEKTDGYQNHNDDVDEDDNNDEITESPPYHRIVSAPSGRIGVTFVEYRGHCYVSDIHDDSPLHGFLHESDILIAIDEITVSGMRVRDIIQILKDRQLRPQRLLRVMSSYDANAAIMMTTTSYHHGHYDNDDVHQNDSQPSSGIVSATNTSSNNNGTTPLGNDSLKN